jgi:hypothetical protein
LLTQSEGGDQPFTLAITGDTGTYRTAHGQIRSPRSARPNPHYTLTVIT